MPVILWRKSVFKLFCDLRYKSQKTKDNRPKVFWNLELKTNAEWPQRIINT